MSPSSSESDRFGTIQVRGARENNLKSISVDILANLSTAVIASKSLTGRHLAARLG